MAVNYGYTLSCEEHPAQFLIDNAAAAEEAGFDFVGISDHFAPWTETQGNSPFSWSVIGGLSQRTDNIDVFIEVVCPTMRYRPAIVAQAAATSASLLEGRFLLGVGTGENLNEHITGKGWPHINVRREMLGEAIEIIRQLFSGKMLHHYGKYFSVEAAKIYSLPKNTPPIIVSGFGPKSIKFAGETGDGLVSMAPNKQLIKAFEDAGGAGKPKYTQLHVCYGRDRNRAKETAFKYWPNAGLGGQLGSELRLPAYYEQAAQTLDADEATQDVILGNDPNEYAETVVQYIDAGYDHIYFHQIGPDQRGFLNFWQKTLRRVLTEL